MTHPWKRLRPTMSASTASMSRWLLGSSSRSTWGLSKVILAKATRLFCPPDILYMALSCRSCGMPKELRWDLIFSSAVPGNSLRRYSRGHSVRSRPSTWCWLNTETRTCWLLSTLPSVGLSFPVIRFSSVVFPAPFAPTSAILLSASTPKLTPRKSSGPLGSPSPLPSYAKQTSSKEMREPVNFPGSGNLKTYSGSSSVRETSSILFKALILLCTMVALLAFARNLVMKSSMCFLWAWSLSNAFFSFLSLSARAFSKLV
mmetsp:Transcript_2281/g.7667  ORF Transcript_2281/g.7667 Transcript_2281/m.7667 type:complete len:259 (+) Transcript_2281:2164-2940(+)